MAQITEYQANSLRRNAPNLAEIGGYFLESCPEIWKKFNKLSENIFVNPAQNITTEKLTELFANTIENANYSTEATTVPDLADIIFELGILDKVEEELGYKLDTKYELHFTS